MYHPAPKRLLLVCVENPARCQVAEGSARVKAGSAGNRPAHVNPLAVEVMREVGVELTAHRSKSVDEFLDDPPEVFITLGAEEVRPLFPSQVRRIHWPMLDLAGHDDAPVPAPLERFRAARDELERHLARWAAMDLSISSSPDDDWREPARDHRHVLSAWAHRGATLPSSGQRLRGAWLRSTRRT
jgi:arsenate reductase